MIRTENRESDEKNWPADCLLGYAVGGLGTDSTRLRSRYVEPATVRGVKMQTLLVIAAVLASLVAAVGAASLFLSVLLRLMAKLR